jgi:DNA-binding phage protein
MALTRSYKETILAELQRDPEFRKSVYTEAVTALLEGEQAIALSMLRDLVHASISFKRLAEETGVSEKSLHRMLGERGNPTIQNIGKILQAIQQDLGYVPQVSVSAA